MLYGKHPLLGNQHFPESERDARVREGWVIWPRTVEQKTGSVLTIRPVVTSPVAAQHIPRPVGRPRKIA